MYKKLIASGMATAVLLGGIFVFAPAYAQTVTTAPSTRVADIIARSNQEISQRIASLNNLNARIGELKNVSSTVKANLSSDAQTNINGLTALQTTIDSGNDVTTLRGQEKSIFTTFRIYALVIPQGYIVAASDRVQTIGGLMTTIAGQLQQRITAEQNKGTNVSSLQAALADMNTQIALAESSAQTAYNGVVTLTPDQGNTTVAASNHAALVAARADIKTSGQDLAAARADIKTIRQGLKAK